MGRTWLPGRAVDYLTFYVMSFFALMRRVGPGDILIAKTDPPMISIVAALAARLKRAHLVNWCQDIFPEVAGALGMRWLDGGIGTALKTVRNTSLRHARLNVVLDVAMARRLKSEGVPDARIKVLHNWADSAIRPISGTQNRLRSQWGYADECVIGYSGNLGRAHLAEQVRKLVDLTAGQPDLRWLFIGGGSGMSKLESDLSDDMSTGRVAFRPYQDREHLSESLSVPDIHLVTLDPACEALIVPSKIYGIMAAGRGIAFLGDPGGSVARLVADNDLGIVLDAAEPGECYRQLAQLVRDKARIQAMGERARRIYDQNYSTSIALSAWQSALTEVNAPVEAPAKAELMKHAGNRP